MILAITLAEMSHKSQQSRQREDPFGSSVSCALCWTTVALSSSIFFRVAANCLLGWRMAAVRVRDEGLACPPQTAVLSTRRGGLLSNASKRNNAIEKAVSVQCEVK